MKNTRGLPIQTLLGSSILVASYLLTAPADNVNWVFGLGSTAKRRRPTRLLAALLLFPLAFYVPAHLLFTGLCPRQHGAT